MYSNLKGLAYPAACLASGRSNQEAATAGFSDVFDLIMSDSDHPRQGVFLMRLMAALSEKQRQILLDGLAAEYADCANWLAYVDRECS